MYTLSAKKIGLVILAIAAILSMVVVFQEVRADITSKVRTNTDAYQYYQFFATSTAQTGYATTTSATSTSIVQWTNGDGEIDNGYFVIAGAKKVDVYFSRAWDSVGNIGTSTFNIQVARKPNPGASDWFNFNKLVQATSTVQQNRSGIEAATSTLQYGMSLLDDGFYAIRCVVVETIDGAHSCSAAATF